MSDNPINKIRTWQQSRFIDNSDKYPDLSDEAMQEFRQAFEKREQCLVRKSPTGYAICHCDDPNNAAWIAERLNLAAKLEEENKILKTGIKAVRDLMDSSQGVAGLHLNGDVAPWEEISEGGQFEEHLLAFNEAEKLLGDRK
jgi:hypothetical protein